MSFVQGFAQGFSIVDQFESNRERRAERKQEMEFRTEQQSRTREIWKREDSEYARIQKGRLQEEWAVSINAAIPEILQSADFRTRAEGLGDDEVNRMLFQELSNRMSGQHPDFLEALGLELGEDPAAGSAVNTSRPVHNLVIDDDGMATFALNTENGIQPLTNNRSADADDNVKQFEINSTALAGVLGQSYYNTGLQELTLMRQFLEEAQGPSPVRNPNAPVGTPAEPEAAAAVPEAPGLTVTPDEVTSSIDTANAAEVPTTLAPDPTFEEPGGFDIPPEQQAILRAIRAGEPAHEQPGVEAMRGLTRSQLERRGFDEREIFLLNRPQSVREGLRTYVETTQPATSTADISKAGATVSDFAPAKIAAALEAGEDSTPVLAQVPMVSDPAQGEALANSIPQGRRPTFASTYNMAMMVKAGMVTFPQAINYLKTGQFDPSSANYKFLSPGGGVIARVDESSGSVDFIDAPGGAGGPDILDEGRLRDFLGEDFEAFFGGDASPRTRADFFNDFYELGDIFGVDIRGSQQATLHAIESYKFQRNYEGEANEGFFQTVRRFFGGEPHQIQTLLPGFHAQQLGIGSQEKFNDFFDAGYREVYESPATKQLSPAVQKSLVDITWDEADGNIREFRKLMRVAIEQAVERASGR